MSYKIIPDRDNGFLRGWCFASENKKHKKFLTRKGIINGGVKPCLAFGTIL